MSDDVRPRRNWLGLIIIIAISSLALLGWRRLRIDNSLEPMLPEKSQARQTIQFLAQSSFAAKAVLWFRLKPEGSISDLYSAADDISKKLDSNLIKRVITPPKEGNAIEEVLGLVDHASQLLNEEDLAEIEKASTPEALRKRMRECFMQLAKPEGSFVEPIMRRDPLGVNSRILSRLMALTNGLGYRVEVKNGRLMHRDGRQMMLILETSMPATSLSGSKALSEHLQKLAASAPVNVVVTPICAQVHTAQNDQMMQHDIQWACMLDTVIFLALFLAVSRDWRVGAIFMLPLATTAITIGLCALVHPGLSAISLGIAAAMAGGAVDYAIYVYTAVRMGRDQKAELKRIRRPLLISHATTVGVFLAFVFSDIPTYRQLGWLTALSLFLCLLAALFVLPRMISPRGKIKGLGSGIALDRWGRKMLVAVPIAAILFGAAIFAARHTRFDPDVTRLDGIEPSVRQAEADFQHTWGRSDTELAMVVVSGATRAEAEQANDKANRVLAPLFPEGQFVSLSSFWPSPSTQEANQARWKAFWTKDRVAKLREDLATAGEPYGFSVDAFEPFFQNITNPPKEPHSRQVIASIEEQFSARSAGRWQMLSYFDDTIENVTAARAALRDWPNAIVVSRKALGQAFAESAASETRRLLGISALFIGISLALLTRSFKKSLVIMLPVITGLTAMLAVLAMMSLPLNVVSVICAILIVGLSSDFGVFATYAYENRETVMGHGMAAMHVAAWTTLAITAALLFARHPALYLVGVSLTSGFLASYLTAFLVIPGLSVLLDRSKRNAS